MSGQSFELVMDGAQLDRLAELRTCEVAQTAVVESA
jgi:hypothetical protein